MRYLGIVLIIISTQTFAEYKYDWRTGNSHNYYTDSTGTTTVRGNNLSTGSSWNTTISPNGDMRGYDSDMNYWNYNNNTGTYINHGTGEMRIRGFDY